MASDQQHIFLSPRMATEKVRFPWLLETICPSIWFQTAPSYLEWVGNLTSETWEELGGQRCSWERTVGRSQSCSGVFVFGSTLSPGTWFLPADLYSIPQNNSALVSLELILAPLGPSGLQW